MHKLDKCPPIARLRPTIIKAIMIALSGLASGLAQASFPASFNPKSGG